MIEKRHSIAAAVIALVLAAACSERRLTEPGDSGPPRLPALNVAASAVLRSSGRYEATAVGKGESDEFRIVIPESVLAAFGTIDDIRLEYTIEYHQQRSLEIYDYPQSRWRVLTPEGPDPMYLPVSGNSVHWLAFHATDLRQSFLGETGTVRLRGTLASANAQLLDYHPDYKPILLTAARPAAPRGLAWINGRIWAVVNFWTSADGRPLATDSIFVFDSTGTRLWAIGIVGDHRRGRIWGITGVADTAWVLTDQRRTFSTIDSTGSIALRFALPDDCEWDGRDIDWALGRLWVQDDRFAGLHGVLVESSSASGTAVMDWDFRYDWSWLIWPKMAWHNSFLYASTSGSVAKINLSGETVWTGGLPVSFHAFNNDIPLPGLDIAWDDDSMWIIHFGPREYTGSAILLSRFIVP